MVFQVLMFRQPSRRIQSRGHTDNVCRPLEGTLLHTILNPAPTEYPVITKGPIHNYDDYLRLFKRNNDDMGIPFSVREYPECTTPTPVITPNEPTLDYIDQVQVSLNVLKSGIVRVKVNTAIATLNEKYYRVYKKPPVRSMIQAYKSHGFSDAFIDKIKMGSERHKMFGKKLDTIIEKIFDKQPVKKIKKKKEIDVEPENEEEENDDDPVPGEDDGLDVEPDEDDVVEEEEYVSDVE